MSGSALFVAKERGSVLRYLAVALGLVKSESDDDRFEQFPTCARGFAEKTPQPSVFAAQRPVGARQAGGRAADSQTPACNPKFVKHSCLQFAFGLVPRRRSPAFEEPANSICAIPECERAIKA